MSLCVIITIIINVTVCDHHDHYPPAAALSRGQNKDLWLEGGDAETMFQPFGIFLGRYVTMQIQRWKGVRMDSNEQMQKGWTYSEDWNLDFWKYDFMDYSTFDPGRILADEGWCIICPHLCGAYIEESFLVEQFHILAVWCITYSYLHIIFPKSKSF